MPSGAIIFKQLTEHVISRTHLHSLVTSMLTWYYADDRKESRKAQDRYGGDRLK